MSDDETRPFASGWESRYRQLEARHSEPCDVCGAPPLWIDGDSPYGGHDDAPGIQWRFDNPLRGKPLPAVPPEEWIAAMSVAVFVASYGYAPSDGAPGVTSELMRAIREEQRAAYAALREEMEK